MRRIENARRSALVVLATLLLCSPAAAAPAADAGAPSAEAMDAAARLVKASGRAGGMAAVVRPPDADLPLALSKQGRFTVHALVTDADRCGAVREAIADAGVYGTVSADVMPRGDALPYADNLLTIVVFHSRPNYAKRKGWLPEVRRVLAPLGTACVRVVGDPPAVEPVADYLREVGFEAVSPFDAGAGEKWVCGRKPWPPNIDEWTHYLHGPDGNPVARDTVVAPPRRYQWTSEPTWMQSHETDSSISTLVTARGRLFAIVNRAPTSLPGPKSPPDTWFLVARDAFNGRLLWEAPIRRWGWREWKHSWFNTRPGDIPLNLQKRLVADGDAVYLTLGYGAPVSRLDARTGAILHTYDGTERTNEILFVSHTLSPGGRGPSEGDASTDTPRSPSPRPSPVKGEGVRERPLGGTLVLSVLAGDGVRVMAVDAATGKQRWITEKTYRGTTVDYIRWKAMRGATKPAKLDPAPNIATDGQATVALIDGPNVVGLDYQTGRQRWCTPFPSDPADETAGNMHADGNLWNGTMIVTGGVVLHASPHRLAALDARTGSVLWTRPKAYIGHLWYEWKDVFVIDGLAWTWGEDLTTEPLVRGTGRAQRSRFPQHVNGYDLVTGEVTKKVPLGPLFKSHHHHRCYRNKATLRYILASRRGTEYVNLAGGPHTIHNWVRGTCHVGMMPANGLQYAPPHPCVCYIEEKINGMTALAPAPTAKAPAAADPSDPSRLVRGPAYGAALGDLKSEISDLKSGISDRRFEISDADWPTFRHDATRTGSVATDVPADAAPRWRVTVGRRVSAPTAVGDRVFAALVDEHAVVCLRAADGRTLWRFTAGGRIDSPPTWYRGTVLFGSADGHLYCVRASDGALVWRFRAAPRDRLMGAFGQLESAWPVHGSVLVLDGAAAGEPADKAGEGGTVYVAAGRSSELDGGIHLYALDAATGRLRHHRTLQGPRYRADEVDENYRLPMGALAGILMSDGTNLYMRDETFDRALAPARGKPALHPKAGFLDDAYFKRTPWQFSGSGDWGRLIVHDNRSVYYVRMFDSLQGLNPDVYFTPGAAGYLLFARDATGKKPNWTQRVPVRIRAMALAKGRLFVAGPPDVVDPADPLGAFEGRKGGRLYVVDASTGERVAEHALPSPPVFNGVAAARGLLFLAEEDGSLACFGK